MLETAWLLSQHPLTPPCRRARLCLQLSVPETFHDRLKGVLFFPWDFPVTNNKLQLQAEPK